MARLWKMLSRLDTPMDLDLVLLHFAEASKQQVGDLVEAASRGSVADVQRRLQVPQDPDLSR